MQIRYSRIGCADGDTTRDFIVYLGGYRKVTRRFGDAVATASAWAVNGAIALRYTDPGAAARRVGGKDNDTVRLEHSDVTVIADLSKKVAWDQVTLAQIAQCIRAAAYDPAEYVETTFRLFERKYAIWPTSIREDLGAARILRPGKPTLRLILGGVR